MDYISNIIETLTECQGGPEIAAAVEQPLPIPTGVAGTRLE